MDLYFRWKKGDINLWVGYANHGKTTFVLQLMLTKSVNDGWKWAIFSPENYPANDFFDDLVEMYIGKWLDGMSEEEYSEACHFINDHFFYVYPEHEHDLNSIQEKFRYLVLKKGVDGVLIDPFNQLDRNGNSFQREDLYLSDQLKDVKRFALLNRVSYNIIAHPVKMQRDSDRSYPPVDMYDIAGGAMFANKSDQIISYYRPNHHLDKTSPDVKILVQKVKRKRTGGQQGDFDIRLDWKIKRYVDIYSGKPFLNPKIEAKPKNSQIQSRLPYIYTNDEDGLENEMPF
jgi:twinkle protein